MSTLPRPHASRMPRTVVIAFVLLVLTLAGHTAADGALPSTFGLLIVSAIVVALTAAISDRRRNFVWLTAYLFGVQVLGHVLLTFTTTHHHHSNVWMTLPMVIGHLVAAMLGAGAIAFGTSTIDSWIRYLATSLFIGVSLPVVRPAIVTITDNNFQTPSSTRFLHHQLIRRGPPAA